MKPSDWNKFESSYQAAYKPGLPPERNIVAAAVDLNRRTSRTTAQSIDFGPAAIPALREIISAYRGLAPDQPIYFASSHDDATGRPMIAWSRNGTAFTRLPLTYAPPAGDSCRDCSIMYYRGRWWMAYTAGNFGAVPYFGIAVSDDLVNWTHHTNVTVPTTDVNFTWAPEWLVVGDTVHIFYSKSYSGTWRIHTVTATNDTLINWTANGVLDGQGGISEIDAHVIRYDGEWIMASRNYGGGGINGIKFHRSSNASPLLGWVQESVIFATSEAEGPSLVNMGDGRLRCYHAVLPYGSLSQSYADSFDGGRTWSAVTPITGNFPAPHMGVKAFLPPAYAAAGQTPPSAQELEAVTNRLTTLEVLPLLDWSLAGWDGSAALPSHGASVTDLTISGATPIEGTGGRQLGFDGVNDYAIASIKNVTNRLHTGVDFTFILEGSPLTAFGTITFLCSTGTLSSASTGFVLWQQAGSIYFHVRNGSTVQTAFSGTLNRIAVTRSGTSVTLRLRNTAGAVFSAAATFGSQAGDSTDFLNLARLAVDQAAYVASTMQRLRIYDRSLTIVN